MSIELKYHSVFKKEHFKEEFVISFSDFQKRTVSAPLLFRMGPYSLSSLPRAFINVLENTQQYHPCTQVYLHDSVDGLAFLEQHYPDIVESYHAILPGAYKSDIVRLCLLEHYGGWYADLSMLFLKPLPKEAFDSEMVLVNDYNFRNDNVGVGITNGFMYSRKNHPLIQAMITHIKTNIEQRVYNHSSLDITGPVALANCFKTFFSCAMVEKGVQGIQIFTKNNVSYPIYWMDFRKMDPFHCVECESIPYLQCKFDGYTQLMYDAFNSKPYWKMWDERMVYKK